MSGAHIRQCEIITYNILQDYLTGLTSRRKIAVHKCARTPSYTLVNTRAHTHT